MSNVPYKIGLRLAQIPFVRSAIDEKADLSAFDHKPTVKIVVGVSLIGFSHLIGMPTVTAFAAWAVYHRHPWLAAVGGPALYGLSHLCFISGMALSGAKYATLFLRWLTRVGVEKLLSFGKNHESASAVMTKSE